ncbi:hypothetical protein E4T51_09096 [Aureobasidium sp. EXF-12344]|nr:hypothetical protein E4T51_09096 [Aureobasidium sp. EXF-12344]
MKLVTTLVALGYGVLSLAQSSTVLADGAATIASGIDPSDVAAIPDPEILGPPIGLADSVPTVTFDAAAVTSSVLALVTANTDAQTTVIASPAETDGSSTSAAVKRSFVGGNTNIHRRDIKYPIDTKSLGIPSGYAPAFINLQGATQGRGYLTYKTLKSYDPALCTAACNSVKTCVFANIYYEKDPDAKNNPVDVIKCALYSMYQTEATATNKGQWRGSFQVLVTGSNGYNKAPNSNAPAGYSMQSLPNAVNAPLFDSQGQGRFIQPVYLDTYSTELCAAACDKQTQWDKSQSSDGCNYKTCVYANLYILSKNGAPQTVVCALYTEATDSSYAVNSGYNYGSDFYQVSNSIALVNSNLVQAGYPMYCEPLAKDVASLRSIGGDFCTSYLGYSASTVVGTVTKTPATSTVQATTTELVTGTSTSYVFQKRLAIPTPSLIANWPAKKISAACSQVATGLVSTTATVIASTPYVTEIVATSTSTVISLATQTCKASLIKGGDVQNNLDAWQVSGQVSVLEDHSAINYHIVGCGSPYCPSYEQSIGASIKQIINFGKCIDQSYTFGFTYHVSGDYPSPYLCKVGFEIKKCGNENQGCVTVIEPGGDEQWWITSTGGSWKTWSYTLPAIPAAEDLDVDLGLSLSCQWYSQVDIKVKYLSLGPSTA